MRLLIILSVLLIATPAVAGSPDSGSGAGEGYADRYLGKQRTVDIRTNWEDGKRKIGTIYDPGYGRPLQVRNNSNQIKAYIEDDGTITNRSRQILLEIE